MKITKYNHTENENNCHSSRSPILYILPKNHDRCFSHGQYYNSVHINQSIFIQVDCSCRTTLFLFVHILFCRSFSDFRTITAFIPLNLLLDDKKRIRNV